MGGENRIIIVTFREHVSIKKVFLKRSHPESYNLLFK
jgi:hypothetical protein